MGKIHATFLILALIILPSGVHLAYVQLAILKADRERIVMLLESLQTNE